MHSVAGRVYTRVLGLDREPVRGIFSHTPISFIGGDAMRVWHLSASHLSVGDSIKAVFLDRVLGFIAMTALALASIVLLRSVAPPAMWNALFACMGAAMFAGRIADTGVDPVPIIRKAVQVTRAKPKAELIWASPRELLNVFQADAVGCHIITATNDILKKLSLVGKDHDAYSLETVEMFYKDAKAAGFSIATREAA